MSNKFSPRWYLLQVGKFSKSDFVEFQLLLLCFPICTFKRLWKSSKCNSEPSFWGVVGIRRDNLEDLTDGWVYSFLGLCLSDTTWFSVSLHLIWFFLPLRMETNQGTLWKAWAKERGHPPPCSCCKSGPEAARRVTLTTSCSIWRLCFWIYNFQKTFFSFWGNSPCTMSAGISQAHICHPTCQNILIHDLT